MNYFQLFDIPVRLSVDLTTVKKKFYELSRKYHPDFYTNASPDEQAAALEHSSTLNKAYKVFQDKDETIKYFLTLKGLLQEEEKYELKPDFLMDVMELNESLMELHPDDDRQGLQELKEKANRFLKEMYEEVAPVIEHYNDGVTSNEALLQVKDYYYRKKYLNRILETINGLSNIAPRYSDN